VRVYLDTSALLKRTLEEQESEAFERELERWASSEAELVSSTLAWIEVTRALRVRLDAESPMVVATMVEETLGDITECPIGAQVVSIARRLGPPSLRSLDAIHLASAAVLDVDLVCAYDQRMLTAAAELGFRTASPG
jgi:predicted nucleic acid-binding protein